MKGIVFTEFLEMVEEKFGLEMVDDIIEKSDLASEGSYTAVGVYDFLEMQQLIVHLSAETGIPVQKLIYEYGRYFFDVLAQGHANIFARYASPIELLASVQDHIHVEVQKLYPGAELPTFEISKKDEKLLEMTYYSKNSLYMFAMALMEKTFEFFKKTPVIDYNLVEADGSQVKFIISEQ
ncbi:MAG: heme NO-binding domain-containing protein [Christiangramia sp.]|nr:hypothetical protein [Christiangramia sp.]|tara:strand:+ start:1029 stop:1568 length:540 start_codon:yes stop_codon:yes gene_type:complete